MSVAIAKTTAWMLAIRAADYAEQLRLNRAVQRKRLGIDQVDLPYPVPVDPQLLIITPPIEPAAGAAPAATPASTSPAPVTPAASAPPAFAAVQRDAVTGAIKRRAVFATTAQAEAQLEAWQAGGG